MLSSHNCEGVVSFKRFPPHILSPQLSTFLQRFSFQKYLRFPPLHGKEEFHCLRVAFLAVGLLGWLEEGWLNLITFQRRLWKTPCAVGCRPTAVHIWSFLTGPIFQMCFHRPSLTVQNRGHCHRFIFPHTPTHHTPRGVFS